MTPHTTRIQVECIGCHYTKLVDPADGKKPAEFVIEHGQETGHKCSVFPVDEEEPESVS